MPLARTSARRGKGKAAVPPSSKLVATATSTSDEPPPTGDDTLAKQQVWKWWLRVFKALLKTCGYSSWFVEAAGECQLLGFAAGHEVASKESVASLNEKQRRVLVTQGLRKPAVALLTKGTAEGFDTQLSESDLDLVAAAMQIPGGRAALPARMKCWLSPYHYGQDGCAMLAALGMLKQRVRHAHPIEPFPCIPRMHLVCRALNTALESRIMADLHRADRAQLDGALHQLP